MMAVLVAVVAVIEAGHVDVPVERVGHGQHYCAATTAAPEDHCVPS